MKSRRIGPLLPVALGGLVALLFVAGCGSSEPTISKAEFIKQANAICESSAKKQQVGFAALVARKIPKAKESVVIGSFVTTVMLPADQKQVEELEALGTPSGDEQQVEAMLAAMQQGVEAGEAQPPQKFLSSESTLQKGRRLARAYGLKACD